MSYAIEQQQWQSLPEHAQREVYDFFLFIKQRYEQSVAQTNDVNETIVKKPRANWFDGYDATKDVDVLASLPADEASEEWE
jgi:hypothetical protein